MLSLTSKQVIPKADLVITSRYVIGMQATLLKI